MSSEQEQQIAVLRRLFEAGQLDKATFEAAAAGLRGSATHVAGAGTGSTVAQDHSTAVAPGAVYIPGSVTGNVYVGEPTADPQEALRIYRQVLLNSSANLPLRGVDLGASDPATVKRLSLANVYIDLDTTGRVDLAEEELAAVDSDQDLRHLLVAQRDEKQRPLPALEATIDNRWLVLTGDPGGGKSTFVNHLAYCLAAHALQPDAGWLHHLPGWSQEDADLLPVVVTLRDFAAAIDAAQVGQAKPKDLWHFLCARLDEQNLGFACPALEVELRHGRAMLFLDGLDEVAGTRQRRFVRDAVAAFAARYPSNRFLVTCRILSYQPPDNEGEPDLRLDLDHFPIHELAPFDEPQIDRFIAAWYNELARVGSVPAQDAQGLAGRLQAAVRRPDLWRMAPNPLLLTVMSVVHADDGRLPDARALLYERTVDLLLWRWDEVKPGSGTQAPALRQLLHDAGRAELDLKRLLWRLAFEAHGRSAEDDEQEDLGDITEAQLTRALLALKPEDWGWAHDVVAAIKLRAGLLLERKPGVFTFPHRTFQEYLAGAHLSTQADCGPRAAGLGAQGALWREAILLAAGRLVYVSGDVDKALALVKRLCPAQQPEGDAGWRNVWLAADALREIGLQRARDDDWGRELLARVRDRLAHLVAGGELAPRERAAAGDTLAELGDPRPGVGVIEVNDRPLPDIEFCYVPPGPFWMGSPDEDPDGEKDETPLHRLDLPYGYWIGRYPVTVAQFRAFAAAAGYERRDRDSLAGVANHPVQWITWYDALAFCRWLDGIAREQGWLPAGHAVGLPSEAEWEKAARGGLRLPAEPVVARLLAGLPEQGELALLANPLPQRRFPWGDPAATPEQANYRDTRLGVTSPPGAFPAGASPFGALDLSGNVFEWTRSRHAAYPYDPRDGREVIETANDYEEIVVRGGSYWTDSKWLRCASRYWVYPYDWSFNLGFRVVVSPLLTSDL